MIIIKSKSFNRTVVASEVNIYTLPKLPYAYDALEPIIDAETMRLHHKKHQATYLDNLLKEIANTDLIKTNPFDLACNLKKVPSNKLEVVKNNLGGFINHTMFWNMMRKPIKNNKPSGTISSLINDNFENFKTFKDEFIETAKKHFGSGWVWLCANGDDLKICATKNQDNPIMGKEFANAEGTPILGLDVWEHAYYLNYQNKRADYAKAWFDVINWDEVALIHGTSKNENKTAARKDLLSGGKADIASEKDFDPSELAKGIKTEMEHTNDKNVAKEIAMDHLTEDPKYYTKLLRAGL